MNKPLRHRALLRFPRRLKGPLALLLCLITPLHGMAGDILRGGAAAGGGRRNNPQPGADATAGGAAAQAARRNAGDALARTSRAIEAVQRLQLQARSQVGGGNGMNPNSPGTPLPSVPDGLGTGGLDPLGAPVGADAPVQTPGTGGSVTVTVKQQLQQAFLEWRTFNVGRNTTLYFDQTKGGKSAGQWIAFNSVKDPTGRPSQILGQIKAEGQVYVINANGIIFGGKSQVNAHALVASALPVNTNLTSSGLLNNPDLQPLFSAIEVAAGAKGTPKFTPDLNGTGKVGDVRVEAGAQITAPTTADKVGGRVVLAGANVVNEGTISTPDGQAILAAGLQVGMMGHSSSDPSLRGLDVFVGAVEDPLVSAWTGSAGTVTNLGIINAQRGNITMAGRSVRQNGVLAATTSVSFNGRIDLQAGYAAVANPIYDPTNTAFGAPFLFGGTGEVVLGQGSVTQILPEWDSSETLVGTRLALPSQVNLRGRVVRLMDDAMLLAPNATVNLEAGAWKLDSIGGTLRNQFVYSEGQVHVGKGAFINVAGSAAVQASILQNILTLQLRGSEFADFSYNRNGDLRGVDLTIDIRRQGVFDGHTWVGTPLADASGFVGLIQRDAAQLTIDGGSLNIRSGGSVILQQGSTLDVSGGYVDYQGAVVTTSRVMLGGRLVDIADATPDTVYDGLYTGSFTTTSNQWGVSRTYTSQLLRGTRFEAGYVYGGSGGSLNIQAPSLALDATMNAGTVNGQRQIEVQAAHSTLSIQLQNQKAVGPTYFNQSPTPPTVLFQSGLTQTAAPDFAVDGSGNPVGLSGDRLTTLLLSPENLKRAGFGKLTVSNRDGNVVLAAGEVLEMQPGGGVTLEGANIDIQGSIVSHGGSVALRAYNLSPFAVDELRQSADPSTPLANLGRGRVTVAGSSVIDVSGSLVDDRFSLGTTPYVLAGGSLSISGYDVDVRAGSRLDVSGGARVDGVLDRTYGRGGNLTLKGGADLNLNWVGGGSLKLAGQLQGMAGTGVAGGSMTLQAPLIQIGGTAGADTLLIGSEFFNQGGFSSHRLIGIGAQSGPETYRPGLVIDASARVKPEVRSYIYEPDGPAMNVRTLLPHPGLRQPSSLTFSATGAVDEFSRLMVVRGDLVARAGSVIDAGARGSVSFTADTVSLLGQVSASGGSITVQGEDRLPTLDPNPQKAFTTVYLGSTARLSTAGSFLAVPDPFGRRIGTLLSGGRIQVSGNIVAEDGSRLDASGTAETVDVIPANLGGNSLGGSLADGGGSVPASSGLTAPVNTVASKPVRLESDGGSIILEGGQMLHTQADLRARAGGATAEGGTLEVSSGRFYQNGVTPEPDDINLSVAQSRPGGAFFADPSAAIGAAPSVPSGIGYFAADDFASGGFDNLRLGGNVAFDGSVVVQARGSLAVATGGVLQASADVLLAGRHVALGKVFDAPLAPTEVPNPFLQDVQPFFFAPTSGGGSLTVQAQLIDIGNLSLQGIGSASFIAENGDIRGNGTFNMAGSLLMRAAQVYPVTGTDFTISVYDPSLAVKGSAAFEAAGSKALPLSAGGSLKVYASNIRQDGVLRAPFGSIELGWNGEGTRPQDLITGSKAQIPVTQSLTLGTGSITSVSGVDPLTGKGLLVPYGTSTDGVSWIDPSGLDITAGGLPEKTILLSSRQITTQDGALQDLRGGGDLLAYRFVSGTSGTRDILADEGLFAVLPGYQDWYAPFGAFNTGAEAASLKGDLGYVNGTIRVGDRVQLGGGAGLAAGLYTLLPARYALLPGAFLITPQSGVPVSSQLRPDGAVLTSGQRYNTLSTTRAAPLLQQRFEIASSTTLAQRAQYDTFSANTFLAAYAAQRGLDLQRLPRDSGRMVLDATSAMSLAGTVSARPITTQGRDGSIDISSPLDIIIGHQDSVPVAGKLLLSARQLSSFGVGSLLIGGVRSQAEGGTAVAVKTRNITVDNMNTAQGEAEVLEGPEIILAASGLIELTADAVVRQSGALSGGAETLLLGSSSVSGSGSGSLLRVSSDLGAAVRRLGVTPGTGAAAMTLGAGSQVSGVSVLLDSTFATTFASSAVVEGTSIGFSSGQVSLVLGGSSGPTSGRGLVLDATALSNLGSARSLSLLSYTTLDTYGSGTLGGGTLDSLSLSAAQIRGFSNSGGVVTFAARRVDIANSANAAASGTETGTAGGTLRIEAEELHLGGNASRIVQYGAVQAEASKGIFLDGSGSLTVGGSLSLAAPWMKSAAGSSQSITSTGAMEVTSAGSAAFQAGGAAASLSLTGSSLRFDSRMTLPGGSVTLRAASGSLQMGGEVSTAGIASGPVGQQRLLQAGNIRLAADQGNVTVSGTLDVSAVTGGEAGRVDISVPSGSVSLGAATLLGTGGASFGLDVRQMTSTSGLHTLLNNAGFTGQRDFRVRDGDVVLDGNARVAGLTLGADAGAIRVTGQVDASGVTGGTIRLLAYKGVTLQSGARLDASAEKVDSAGKGGDVYLETRGQSGGQIDIQSGSVVDLSVDAALTAGQFSGTLHLRAPQTGGGTDLALRPVAGSVLGASAITAEGFQVYDLTGGGTITTAVRDQVLANGNAFAANESAITSRLFTGGNAALASSFVLLTGAELVNRTGDLTLGNTNPGAGSTAWDLSGFRFGARQSAGVLTLRASGNLVFNEALSDGFTSAAYNAQLMTNNSLVSDHVEGWSYRLAAGADFSSVDHRSVVQGGGSLLLGRNAGDANEIASNLGERARTSVAVAGFYQVIRTGGGGIDISTGADVRLLNQYATIYSAGVRVADPTMGGRFDLPILDYAGGTSSLGPIQQTPPYAVQYAQGGGNVEIRAGNDIIHLTRNAAGELVADSQRQLPMNWLYRRGYVDPMTGQFGTARFGDVATTSWWVDYSNFFEGVGALGGGNVSMTAGRDIANVDAVVPTNARLSKDGVLTELGGGSLSVQAGRNLDAGVYYVERGAGSLRAGGAIITNATRSPSLTNLADAAPLASQAWLPTQLFVGKSSFDVRAGRDVLIAPASNPFLLPGGYSNSFWYKTYFNTYSQDASVSVTSLSGSVTLRSSTTLPTVGGGGAMSVLLAWIQNQLLYNAQNPGTSSYYHPWLRLNETKVDSFGTVASLAPGSLKLAALGGDVNVVGGFTLAPSSRGTLDILATGSVNALQPNGRTTVNGASTTAWGSSIINVSDASPQSIPGLANPFAFQTLGGLAASTASASGDNFLLFLDASLRETGSTQGAFGVLQAKQALHAQGLLHAGDTEPVRVTAQGGDISGLGLFTPKMARILAARDIRDVAFYLQNTAATDVSVVSSGRDMILYDAGSLLRTQANSSGNIINVGDSPLAGDIQVSGPGSLEVLAGRHLDLGSGGNNSDGTGVGITSIGNGRNPSLPFDGASLTLAAGIGPSAGLAASSVDFSRFITEVINGPRGGRYLSDYAKATGSTVDTLGEFQALSPEEQRRVALGVFAIALRTAGREHSSEGTDYEDGFAAIGSLFPGTAWSGDITTQARDIRTKSGGGIDILVPGGGLKLATALLGNSLAPPGIITEGGGGINIFADQNVDIGIARIFTLRGGDEVIWSSKGDIAAGSSSKTVQSAPPTRVIIDPQSADLKTDLAGLATGGGIGVLATVAGVPPGNVDLIAPNGTVDAGDAGIRATGNLNIAATVVLNSGNISVGGTASGGAAAPAAAAVNVSGMSSSSNTAAAAANTAATKPGAAKENTVAQNDDSQTPSLMSVEVLGYGGGEGEEDEEQKKRRQSLP
jgi:filamentous hemagglutinin family protein